MMLIKENLPVIIERHPRHESLNTKILKDARDFGYSEGQLNLDGGVSNVKAPKTVSIGPNVPFCASVSFAVT